MDYLKNHVIPSSATIRNVLAILDQQAVIANVLFVTDESDVLIGSLTDGDIRRGLLKGISINDTVDKVMNPNCKFETEGRIDNDRINKYKKAGILFIPLVDENKKIVSILNLKEYKSPLPVDTIIMAGGKGKRLMPLTKEIPKPLLKVGDKPIIEYNIDRLKNSGVKEIYISINYLGEQLVNYFGNGAAKEISIKYIKEEKPLGTLGSVKLLEKHFKEDSVLIMNSDLLTTIDFEEFYITFIQSNADMAIAATSYYVDIPYAVMEVNGDNTVKSLKEKPRYTYYSNAGIYLLKKEMLCYIPDDKPFDSTDLMEILLQKGKKLITFPILGYWLDIGKIEDYKKAQEDIKHFKY